MVCGVVDLLLRGKRYLKDLKFFASSDSKSKVVITEQCNEIPQVFAVIAVIAVVDVC